MTIREKLQEQARIERKSKYNGDLGIKLFACWVIRTMKLKERSQNSGLDSWSADVNALITNDEELKGLYARWVLEKDET